MKYIPTLEVSENSEIVKIRELPSAGEVLVGVGDHVKPEDIVLRVLLPGEIEVLRLVEQLGVEEVADLLRVRVGDSVTAGQILAETSGVFGFFKETLRSPITGTIEYFTEINGHLGIRGAPTSLEVKAYIDGTVSEVNSGRSVTIETTASIIQGVFGLGGERFGEVLALDLPNNKQVTHADLLPVATSLQNKVLVGGMSFHQDAFALAAENGVSAIVTGSINSADLKSLLGYELGVSITGDENTPFTFIATEGFGELPLGQRVSDLAKRMKGHTASVNGATQVRAGAMRPELIVSPAVGKPAAKAGQNSGDLSLGSPVRILCYPHYGQLGIVKDLPSQPELIPSGAIVRVLRITIGGGAEVTVPRSNVELV